MKQENKIFGILAIVLGAIALLGSWIPGINQISFLIAILALILGIVGLCLNRKNKKVLAIIGTVLSVASIVFAVGSQVIYNQSKRMLLKIPCLLIKPKKNLHGPRNNSMLSNKEIFFNAELVVQITMMS